MSRKRSPIAGTIVLLSIAGSLALSTVGRPEEGALEDGPPALVVSARSAEAGAPRPLAAAEGYLGVILPRASVDVAARYEGRLRAVHVRLGDTVAEGGLIATIDAPEARFDLATASAELKTAQVEHEKAKVELTEAREKFARRKQLSADALTSGEDLATARFQEQLASVRVEATRAHVDEQRTRVEKLRQTNAESELRAPFEAIVAARYADPGANVTSSTPILRLISVGDMFVRFAVPEEAVASFAVGTPVRVVSSRKRIELAGVVEKIAPEIDAASRMIVVEAKLPLEGVPSGALLAGEAARVSSSPPSPPSSPPSSEERR